MRVRNAARRGSALLLATIGVMVVSAIGVALMSLSFSQSKTTLNASLSDMAFHAAEAGIDDAMNKLKAYAANPSTTADYSVIGVVQSGNKNVVTGSLESGAYTVEITPAYSGPGEYTLRSSGVHGGLKRGIQVIMGAQPTLPYRGLFSKQVFNTVGTFFLDSYSSSAGTYASQLGGNPYALENAHLETNGNINLLTLGTQIHGDASPGPGGSFNAVLGASVSGSTAPASQTYDYPAPPYAPPIASSGNYSWLGLGTLNRPGGVYRYDNFTVLGVGTLQFTGNTTLYVDNNITIVGNVKVAAGSTLTIVHGTGTMTVVGGLITGSKSPADLSIVSSSSGNVTLAGVVDFHGSLYAPKANFYPTSLLNQYYGGFVVKNTLMPAVLAKFHYDEDLSTKAGPVIYSVVSWGEFAP